MNRGNIPQLRVGVPSQNQARPADRAFFRSIRACFALLLSYTGFFAATIVICSLVAHFDSRLTLVEEAALLARRDVIGRRDYAWRYNGAQIIEVLTTPGQKPLNSPFMALDDDLRPGKCWPIHGSKGQLGLRFTSPVIVSHITLNHIPREIAMHPDNAPRRVKVWGLQDGHGKSPQSHERPPISSPNYRFTHLATIMYDINASNHIQTFPVTSDPGTAFHGVVAEILNNWGGDRTCLYRIRVHGSDSTHRS